MKLPFFDALKGRSRLAAARTEPLQIRDGVRYDCFGDGLCCTDIHAIGPIRLAERARLRLVHDGIVAHDPRDDVHIMVMRQGSGACIFHEEGQCAIHEPLNGLLKPSACMQFPISLTATPAGGRITTEHKCPCRTLGERPLLTVEAAMPAISHRGKLAPTMRIGDKVPYAPGDWRSFDAYARDEAALLERIRGAKSVAEVAQAFDARPFPEMNDDSWERMADEFLELSGTTRLEEVMRWMGVAILSARGRGPEVEAGERARPWADAFERGIARSETPGEPLAMLIDFVSDHVWAMHWADECGFEQFRADMATRVTLYAWLTDQLEASGVRPDQAAAEAIMMIELSGTTGWWTEAVRRFVLD